MRKILVMIGMLSMLAHASEAPSSGAWFFPGHPGLMIATGSDDGVSSLLSRSPRSTRRRATSASGTSKEGLDLTQLARKIDSLQQRVVDRIPHLPCGAVTECRWNSNFSRKLTGELIELRPLRPEDFDALLEAASDPLIWEQHPESDRYKREVFQKYFDGAIASKGAFAVIDRASGRIIGSSRYCNLKPAEGEVEIGWTFLVRDFWGGPYNGEMKSLMIAHAFQFIDRVVFVVGENNVRSQKALQKIGARFSRKGESQNLVFEIARDLL